MIDYDKVFEALPHVSTLWVTKDGNFHLHPHNGGEQINRDELEPIKPIDPHLGNDQPDELEPIEQPEIIEVEPIIEPDEIEQPEIIEPEQLNEPRQKRAYNKRK